MITRQPLCTRKLVVPSHQSKQSDKNCPTDCPTNTRTGVASRTDLSREKMMERGNIDASASRRARHYLWILAMFSLVIDRTLGWGVSGSSQTDDSIYGNTFVRDWLYNSKSISLKVEGCAWGYVEDSESVGCLEDGSDDGTTNWYMMANCKRPQVVFSVYASNSGSTSCNNGNLVGSFVTTSGLSEFIYYLQTYDSNFNYNGDDTYGFDALPHCSQGNKGYIGLDCNSNDGFSISYFNDQYCVSRTGNVYNKLSSINKMINNYESCMHAWSFGDDSDSSLVHKLVYYSEPCTSLDYNLCQDNAVFQTRSASVGKTTRSRQGWASRSMGGHKSWVTKLKYVVGGLFLLASFIMFTGILFTNRRRRRAMMMRKYRQAKKAKREKQKDSSSKRSGSKPRSKSRNREGVFT